MESVAGAVLTGGASRRMGRTKALLDVGGTPMALRVVAALRHGGCEPVVLVGGDAAELAPLGERVVPDLAPGEGPLGGVISALAALGRPVVVAACDLPELTGATVARIITAGEGSADVVIGAVSGRRQAVLLVTPAAGQALAQRFDDGQRSLIDALAACEAGAAAFGVEEVTVDEAELRNVNAPSDLYP